MVMFERFSGNSRMALSKTPEKHTEAASNMRRGLSWKGFSQSIDSGETKALSLSDSLHRD